MALVVTICDDQQAELDYLSALVKRWAPDAAVYTHKSAESFLFHREEEPFPDILLLDIQMGKMDGMELAGKIREQSRAVQLVFVTGYPDFMAQGYDVAALHYLLKPIREETLFSVLNRAGENLKRVPRTVLLPKGDGSLRVSVEEILYAEVMSHRVTLCLTRGTEELSMRISDLETLLGDGFFRCHRSYIVSMARVRRVLRTGLILENGKEIPLARGLYDRANQEFIRSAGGVL